jgi:DNA polymerase-3 subunit epsilon
VQEYAALARLVGDAWLADVRPLVEPLRRRLADLSDSQRYEDAGELRDRITSLVRACARTQRLRSLCRIGQLVAAVPADGGWEISVIQHGRLAAAGTAARGQPAWPVVDALLATADADRPDRPVLAEESECVLRWLEQPGMRLVRVSEPWSLPAAGAGGLTTWLAGSVGHGQRLR